MKTSLISLHVHIQETHDTHVNRPEAGTMPGSHVLVQALNSRSTRELPKLLVHVMGT